MFGEPPFHQTNFDSVYEIPENQIKNGAGCNMLNACKVVKMLRSPHNFSLENPANLRKNTRKSLGKGKHLKLESNKNMSERKRLGKRQHLKWPPQKKITHPTPKRKSPTFLFWKDHTTIHVFLELPFES